MRKSSDKVSDTRRKGSQNDESMEGSLPAMPAKPGTLKVNFFWTFIKVF